MESTHSQILSGDFIKIPIIVGANNDEGTAFIPIPANTDDDLITYILSQGPDQATADRLLELYPDDPAVGIPSTVVERPDPEVYGVQYKRACAYNGDYYFVAGRRFTAEQWAAHGVAAYSYWFNTAPYTGEADFVGVTHSYEIPFVFANTIGVGYTENTWF